MQGSRSLPRFTSVRTMLLFVLLVLSFAFTAAGEVVEKPPYPLPKFDYDYYTHNLATTVAKQIESLIGEALSKKVAQEIDCGPPLGKFYNCNGTCYQMGMPNCDYEKTLFFLRNSADLDLVQELEFYHADLTHKTNFNNKCQTVLIIHGYTESANIAWMLLMEKALFWKYQKSCLNVIRISHETNPNFDLIRLAKNGDVIGRRVGIFIQEMVVKSVADPDMIHLIGFSFGGVVTSYAAKYLVKNGIHLGRITGLDPSGPTACYWEGVSGGLRLNPTLGKYVDIIHTNGGFITGPSGLPLGCMDSLGHVDYFVNGGMSQPGCNVTYDCPFKSFPAPSNLSYGEFEMGKYFTCNDNNCGLMGFHSKETKARGIQFDKTLRIPPYCGSQFAMHITVDSPAALRFEIELSQGNISTGKMPFISMNTAPSTSAEQVVIGKYAPFVVNKKTKLSAKISLAIQPIKTMKVTDVHGKSTFYCTSSGNGATAIAKSPMQNMRINLTDTTCQSVSATPRLLSGV